MMTWLKLKCWMMQPFYIILETGLNRMTFICIVDLLSLPWTLSGWYPSYSARTVARAKSSRLIVGMTKTRAEYILTFGAQLFKHLNNCTTTMKFKLWWLVVSQVQVRLKTTNSLWLSWPNCVVELKKVKSVFLKGSWRPTLFWSPSGIAKPVKTTTRVDSANIFGCTWKKSRSKGPGCRTTFWKRAGSWLRAKTKGITTSSTPSMLASRKVAGKNLSSFPLWLKRSGNCLTLKFWTKVAATLWQLNPLNFQK